MTAPMTSTVLDGMLLEEEHPDIYQNGPTDEDVGEVRMLRGHQDECHGQASIPAGKRPASSDGSSNGSRAPVG